MYIVVPKSLIELFHLAKQKSYVRWIAPHSPPPPQLLVTTTLLSPHPHQNLLSDVLLFPLLFSSLFFLFLFFSFFFDSSHPKGCEMISDHGFDLHFPDDNLCWASFHMHLYMHMYMFKWPFVYLLWRNVRSSPLPI